MGNHLINETLMEEEEETFQTSAASHLKCLLPLFVSAIYACAVLFFYLSAAYVLMCFNFIYMLLCFVLCFYNMI